MLLTLPIRDIAPSTPRARIVRLDLGGAPFEFAPGQAVLVATHGRAKRRPYSIACAPEDVTADRAIELLVGVDATGQPGPHLALEPGSSVDVEGPLGTFVFPRDPVEERFVFIAGGTGIAPLRSMLRHALAIPHRDIGVFYSARTPGEFAYERELRDLAAAGRIVLRQTVTRATGEDWTGARGRLDRAALSELVHSVNTLCFICGPPALVMEMKTLLAAIGVDRSRIRIEEWS